MLAQPGIVASHGEPLADHWDAKDNENVEASDPHGLLPQLLRLDLKGKSKFRNGEYQYLLRIAAHSLPNFENSHFRPISKALKLYKV